ncbi:hypothetical protein CWS43_18640 [Rahnella sp. AA]|uniref:hypothetical protein n=1 Tax=Rahnella sp. AA TaxID=2057180 RepID=UPI000C33FC3F|nr:hypothetical protein [Rahnella sp. AA]PKE28870.1 hypothetical protein CWS43_18640 [Rahnella sp. AA]
MGDFERIFGAGADVISIIDNISRFEMDTPDDVILKPYVEVGFYTYDGAREFFMKHQGTIIKRHEIEFLAHGFRHASYVVFTENEEGIYLSENFKYNKDVAFLIPKKFLLNFGYTENKKLDTLTRKLFGRRLITHGVLNLNLFNKLKCSSGFLCCHLNERPQSFELIKKNLNEVGLIAHTLSDTALIIFDEEGVIYGVLHNKFEYTLVFAVEGFVKKYIYLK